MRKHLKHADFNGGPVSSQRSLKKLTNQSFLSTALLLSLENHID